MIATEGGRARLLRRRLRLVDGFVESYRRWSRRTRRTPTTYVTHAPMMLAAKPTVRSFTPAMQLLGMMTR